MTTEHAIDWIRKSVNKDSRLWKAIESLVPELAESEDEKMRKWLITQLETNYKGNYWASKAIEYLEKQKEQIGEDLSTRLNGVMQEYVKAGKDEEDQEHRLKCYQLFWDALGDSEFFKQKEQKPVKCIEFTNEFENQVSHLLASILNGEYEYSKGFIEYTAQSLLGYAKKEQKLDDVKREWWNKGYFKGRKYAYIPAKELGLPSSWDFQQKQKPVEYLSKRKVYDIMNKLTELSTSNLIPFNSDEYKKINEITGDVHSLLDYPIEQKSVEWSKEEIGHLYTLASYIKSKGYEDDGEFLEGVANKLKSLRPPQYCENCKLKRSVENWKPSEEQMNWLESAVRLSNDKPNIHGTIISLYEQLKKLM